MAGEDYVPSASEMVGPISDTFKSLTENSTIIISLIAVFFVLFLIMKVISHRILVEKITKVKGGYVITTGRYRLEFDKKSKRPSLIPMFGKERLPPFNSQYFQKINGFPIFGCMRALSLVFLNKYSPLVVLPGGEIKHIDVKRWQFDNEKDMFIREQKRGDIVYFLGIYAPAFIIIGAIVFWAVCIILQMNITEWYAEELKEVLLRLKE